MARLVARRREIAGRNSKEGARVGTNQHVRARRRHRLGAGREVAALSVRETASLSAIVKYRRFVVTSLGDGGDEAACCGNYK